MIPFLFIKKQFLLREKVTYYYIVPKVSLPVWPTSKKTKIYSIVTVTVTSLKFLQVFSYVFCCNISSSCDVEFNLANREVCA